MSLPLPLARIAIAELDGVDGEGTGGSFPLLADAGMQTGASLEMEVDEAEAAAAAGTAGLDEADADAGAPVVLRLGLSISPLVGWPICALQQHLIANLLCSMSCRLS